MDTILIKPLSVNAAYRGRRFSTPELKAYKQELALRLPRGKVPKGKLRVYYQFGVSSKSADIDNNIKALQDCLSEKYGFNDNKIYKLSCDKIDVKKGKEFLAFSIESLDQ